MGPEEAAQKLEEMARRLRDPRQPVLFFVAVFADAVEGGNQLCLMRHDCDPADVAKAMGEATATLGTGAVVPISRMPEELG